MTAKDGPPPEDDGASCPAIRGPDSRASARLRQIADRLGVPVDRFYGGSARPNLSATEAEEQERRLLSAFRSITDPAMRQRAVDLVEALAPDLGLMGRPLSRDV